ncbi:MAG: S8 family serine peptidase [Verrucomicrobiota bacterium]|nr:S8 family serine peptidase [Verrucomicrobiota bacterium]
MRFSPRTWALLSVLFFVGALFFWLKGNDYQAKINQERQRQKSEGANTQSARTNTAVTTQKKKEKWVLTNSSRSLSELVGSDHAILLRNATIDTAESRELEIPANLRSQSPAAFIVQASGVAGKAFKDLLASEGMTIVSYVPNNAFLVRANSQSIQSLKANDSVRAVIPFDPYFKLDARLMEMISEDQTPPVDALIRLTLFSDLSQSAEQYVKDFGMTVVAREPSPFGPQLLIELGQQDVVSIAKIEAVQSVELQAARTPANDLTRVQLGVSADTVTNANYMDLTGTNIWVNINDFAIDESHEDLKDRVFSPFPGMLANDPNGHGTFVAAVLAGDGSESATVTKADGSLTNASYRGIAPAAKLFALPIEGTPDVQHYVLDTWLQETAARTNYLTLRRTNSLISNNSWVYSGVSEYDSSAARFDAATRDSLSGASGQHPVVYVFPAGNAGFGQNTGRGGEAGNIFSPGTAKNVITVGALEHPRFLTNGLLETNEVIDFEGNTNFFVTTNFLFFERTDSSDSVASYSSRGNTGIGTEGLLGRFKPDVVAPGTFVLSARSKDWVLTNQYDINTEEGRAMTNLHETLGEYRYESGTTFAVPAISGLLALIQEFFETKVDAESRRALSPALMKALLINSSRSVSSFYDYYVQTSINYQGWGLPTLPQTLPEILTNTSEAEWPLILLDQNPTNALATGESRTWRFTLDTNAQFAPLRVTLVWTDPPANPNVGVKLVNDLDLIITNIESGVIYSGNNFSPASVYTTPLPPTEGSVPSDIINNVENIFIRDPSEFGKEFTLTVRARRVNINAVDNGFAVTGRTNDVLQDFALVISSENIFVTNAFKTFQFESAPSALTVRTPVTPVENGIPLMDQRVGANPSLGSDIGNTNQWRFYVFTNFFDPATSTSGLTNGSNVAFVTFAPLNLGRPRNQEADIDLYVSRDSRLTNLVPSVVAGAVQSTTRSGTEFFVTTNAPVGQDVIYYVGVKSEDQQSAEFNLMAISSDLPFQEGDDANPILRGFPIGVAIPDGTPTRPQAGIVIALGLSNRRILNTAVNVGLVHEEMGDLVGTLEHNRIATFLNNHRPAITNFPNPNSFHYNDSFFPPAGSFPTDGPGTLQSFVGQKVVGPWIMYQIDNAPGHVGYVTNVTIPIQTLQDELLSGTISGTVAATNYTYYPLEIRPGINRVTLRLRQKTGLANSLDLVMKLEGLPTTNDFTYRGTNILVNATTLNASAYEEPFLVPGTYYVGVYNRSLGSVDFDLTTEFDYAFLSEYQFEYHRTNTTLLDAAATNNLIELFDDLVVTDVRVGVRMDHQRLSDMTLSLLSPQGTRILLSEARGAADTNGFGSQYLLDGVEQPAYAIFTESDFGDISAIKEMTPPFGDSILNLARIFTNSWETTSPGNKPLGSLVEQWRVTNAIVTVVNNQLEAFSGTNYLILEKGAISRSFPSIPGREYLIRFAAQRFPDKEFMSWWTAEDHVFDFSSTNHGIIEPAYTTGIVSRAWSFNGTSQGVLVPHSDSLNLTNNFTVEFWLNPHASQRASAIVVRKQSLAGADGFALETGSTANSLSYHMVFNGNKIPAGVVLRSNEWQHVALVKEGTIGRIYVNGALRQTVPGLIPILATNNAALEFGRSLFLPNRAWRGLMDEPAIFARVLTQEEIASIYQAGPEGKCASLVGPYPCTGRGTLTLNGEDLNFSVAPAWIPYFTTLIATNTNVVVEFSASRAVYGLDEIEVLDRGNRYFLPEEDLSLLNGQRSLGEWQLQMVDTRTGATNPAGLLNDWELILNFVDARPHAELLLNQRIYPRNLNNTTITNFIVPGRLATNQVQYFIVETCPATTASTVTILGQGVELLVDRSGLPTGDPTRDDYAPVRTVQNSAGAYTASFRLTTTSPPSAPLRPGRRYYLAVRNVNSFGTNNFSIRVDYNNSSCAPIQPQRLLSRQSVENAAAAASANEEGDAYEIQVEPQTESLQLSVQTAGALSVFIGEGFIPNRTNFTATGNVTEGGVGIVLDQNSSLPLKTGNYYVTVLNNNDEPVPYTITSITDNGPADLPRLVNGVAVTGSIGDDEFNIYHFPVPANASAVLFELLDLSEDVNLYVRKGIVPTLNSYDYSSANAGRAGEQIVLRADEVDLAGDWFLGVRASESGPVSYRVLASFASDGILTGGAALNLAIEPQIQNGNLEFSWNSVSGEKYRIDFSDNLIDWKPVQTITAEGRLTSFNEPLPEGVSARFYRIVQVP